MIGIYKITNPLGKVYIGQSIDIERRLKEYSNPNRVKKQVKLYNSICKYSVSEHIFEVVEECIIEELNERERYWQDYYNVIEKGLNCLLTKTEDKSGKMSEDTKRKIGKPVIQYSLQGLYIKEWNTIAEAGRALRIDYTRIPVCCKGRIKSSNGYIWRYKEGETPLKISPGRVQQEARIEKRFVAVSQFNKKGDLLAEWNSIKEASNMLQIGRTNISSCLKGNSKTAGGFIWKYRN
jgi:group I intron endonuclease